MHPTDVIFRKNPMATRPLDDRVDKLAILPSTWS